MCQKEQPMMNISGLARGTKSIFLEAPVGYHMDKDNLLPALE